MRMPDDALIEDLYKLASRCEQNTRNQILALIEPYLPERYSVCTVDGEPLVSSLEVKYKEWVCEVCHRYYGFLDAVTVPATPERHLRYFELRAISRERRLSKA